MKRNCTLALAITLFALVAAVVWAQKPVALEKLPFSAARKAGNTLYVSGQVARTQDGEDIKESVAAETRQVMDNIGRILKDN